MKNDNSLIETIPWITPFIDVKTMNIHQMVILIEKTTKTYPNAMILSLKNYENILKLSFFQYPPPIRHIDCLGKYFKVVIYQNEGVVFYKYIKNNLWIDTSKHRFIRCKIMKT